MPINSIIASTKAFTSANMPEILTGLGLAGLVGGTAITIRGTLKADEVCRREFGGSLKDSWANSKSETLKAVWREALPTVAITVVSTAAVIGANRIGATRATAMASAYALTERAYSDYKAKVIETVGKEEHKQIQSAVAAKQMITTPQRETEVILTDGGMELCYDSYSGRYFRSSVEAVRKAQNDINHELIAGTWVSLNRLYDFLGLDHILAGEDLGWSTDDLVEMGFAPMLSKSNTPCIVINYVAEPRIDPYRSY